MKRAIAFLFILSISAVFASAQTTASANHHSDEQAIRSLNEKVLKAFNMGDVSTVDSIEDVDFLLTGDFGVVTKSQQLSQMRGHKEDATEVHLTTEDVRFRFYGDSALLTEVEKYDDPAVPDGYETTSLWVRRGSQWKVVHLHYSKLNKKH
jgi:ketosteroid isomerase-like protein